MSLETMEPNPVWVEDAYAETVDVFASYGEELTFRVFGGDWCKDCRAQLPDFGAALTAAEVPTENVVHHELDEDKRGPGVEEHGVEYIPTVVVEHGGEEIVRFVEEEAVPIAVYLADEIETELGSVTDH
jgi:thiol-disulfide isomerase/thioredoxin